MSQCDRSLGLAVLVPEVRNESEDLGGDPIDWGEPVSPVSDQAEDLESVLLKNVDLKEGTFK